MLDLSVCSIVRDEERNVADLARCLPLHKVEWVVVDTGSRDSTVQRLREWGVEPRAFEWVDDFAAARNASLALATRGWILWLDADDRLEPSFWKALEPLLQGPRRAYRFVVRSPREGSRGECFRQIRLFPNGLGLAFEGRIHEQLGTSLGRLGVEARDADLEILHLGYDTAAKREAKRRRNLALLEREREEHPRDPAVAMEYGNCLCQAGTPADAAAARKVYLSLLPAADPSLCGAPPDDEVLRHFPSLVAETYARCGDEEGAARWFALAARWNPDDLNALYRLGKRALGRGDLRAALEIFHAVADRPVTVGKVATDHATVRRNALGLVVLCEMQLFGAGKAPRARDCLRDLFADTTADLPFDPRLPFEFCRDADDLDLLETYVRRGLPRWAPGDLALWEDALELLLAGGRPAAVLDALAALDGLSAAARPAAETAMGNAPAPAPLSGTLEAFRGRALEESGADPERVYATYRRALIAFPDDPTVLVYFSGYVNHNRLYARCYADLKAVPRPSGTVRDFLSQLESQGLAGPGADSEMRPGR
jgi:glycosyltransferase involved in cell wall biosynthesis